MISSIFMVAAGWAADSSPWPTAFPGSPSPLATADIAAEFGSSSVDFTFLFIKMIFAMIFVIALAVVVIRYILPRLAFKRRHGIEGGVKIVDRIPLDSRKFLYVLEVEGRRLLVGVSDQHTGLITELKGVNESTESPKS